VNQSRVTKKEAAIITTAALLFSDKVKDLLTANHHRTHHSSLITHDFLAGHQLFNTLNQTFA
jgi:hypothetical protein